MTNIDLSKLFLLLFLLFLIGVAYLIYFSRKDKSILVLSRLSLVIILFIPFSLYFLAGLINIRFGWARNFFYLLPVYFLVIFYGLKVMIGNKKYYYIVSAIILVFLLRSGVNDSISWEKVNLEREMVRYAGRINCSSVIILPRKIAKWPFEYYTKEYGIKNKVVFLRRDDDIAAQSMILEKIPKGETFAIIEMLNDGTLIKETNYSLGTKSLKIVKKEEHRAMVGPFQSFKEIFGYSTPRVAIYYCKNSIKDE